MADDERLTALMIGYQNGNGEDFAGLYEALSTPLRRYLWSFVHDAAMAEDLLQETFLQIHRARHTYTPSRPVRPWVYAISRHVALMHLRSARRRKEVLPKEELPDLPVPPEVERLGDRTVAWRLLDQLPRSGREVLILHHVLGLTFQEVGEILGLAAGTAKVRAHRAIKALRNRMESTEEGSP